MNRNVVETIVGALVLAVAGLFTFYAFTHSGSARPAGYELVARFDRVDGIKRGSDVTLAGVKVGTVASLQLDPTGSTVMVRMVIDNSVKVQDESVAKIASESLLGGSLVTILPCCGPEKMLPPGEEFKKTEGYRSLVDLLIAAVGSGLNVDKPKN